MASDHRARAKGDEATHSPRSWETKGSRKAPLKRTSVMLSSRIENSVSGERHNKCYTREKGVRSGVGGGHKEED